MKNYCSVCRQKTNHTILFTKELSSSSNDDFHWSESYQVIQCNGCENILFKKTYVDETMYSYSDDYEEQYISEVCYPRCLTEHHILNHNY